MPADFPKYIRNLNAAGLNYQILSADMCIDAIRPLVAPSAGYCSDSPRRQQANYSSSQIMLAMSLLALIFI